MRCDRVTEWLQALDQLWDKPDAYLKRLATVDRGLQSQLGALAVMRLAPQEPEAAAEQLSAPWAQRLRTDWSAAAWAAVTRAASLKQLESAAGWAERALQLDGRSRAERAAHTGAVAATDLPGRSSVFTLLSDDMLAWIVRASLREVAQRPQAWLSVAQAIERMSPAEQAEPTWSYWRARALLARSRPGSAGEVLLSEAQDLLRRIASPLHFYGQLAGAELGERPAPLPSAPELDAAERQEAASKPGLVRALRMLELGLRSEGLREWNFTLIGQTDRQILAAAALACDRQVVDRCISAAERTREQTDASLRYPLAFREEITAAAQASGVDAALVFGLIRQESRFAIQARSSVGAAGLMQVMPPTARWTAKRIGLELPADWRDDRATNLRLGTAYLRMVVDDFGASLPMALAAYNAGPSRSRRWREGPTLEPAIWAETIPFHETRDYVKKVLANAAVYAQRLGSKEPAALKGWLGPSIGPRDPSTPLPNKELP